MSYVKHILLPSEQILYDGHVHPTVLLPGALVLAIAAWILTGTGNTGGVYSLFLGFVSFLGDYIPQAKLWHYKLAHWQNTSPAVAFDLKILAMGIGLYGFAKLVSGLVLMETTELIVTDRRVIAKTGILTVTTIEMDRRRIAGVTVYQTLFGRILGYGHVLIQGFTSHIGGLPPMVKPHLVERFVG